MHPDLRPRRVVARIAALAGAAALVALAASPVAATTSGYTQTNLTGDPGQPAKHTGDTDLINAWGLAEGPSTPWWINDNGTGKSTIYDGNGVKQALVVTIPPPCNSQATAAPTGMVFNGTTDFDVQSQPAVCTPAAGLQPQAPVSPTPQPAFFIFSTEDGTISAWSPLQTDKTRATLEVNQAGQNSVFKGLAIGVSGGKNYVYATDFRNRTIAAFDKTFAPAGLGPWTDTASPAIPADFAPFGIQQVGGQLIVSYAQYKDATHHDDSGTGGYVSVFNTDGSFVKRLISNGVLNSPWGIAKAPAGFGDFANDLLVGNFGDGKINAFDPASGAFAGTISNSSGQPILINGLWGLAFGNGAPANKGGDPNQLYFTAGPRGEQGGLFGVLAANAAAAAPAATAAPALPRAGAIGGAGNPAALALALGGLAIFLPAGLVVGARRLRPGPTDRVS